MEKFKYFDLERMAESRWDEADEKTKAFMKNQEWLINLAYEDGYNDGRRNGINHWLGSRNEPRRTYEKHREHKNRVR
jgi:hypothetical protein